MSLNALELRCPRCELDDLRVEITRHPSGRVTMTSNLCGRCGHHVFEVLEDAADLALALERRYELHLEVLWFAPAGDTPERIRCRIVGIIPINATPRQVVDAAEFYGLRVSEKALAMYEADWPSWLVEIQTATTPRIRIAQMRHCVVLRRDDGNA